MHVYCSQYIITLYRLMTAVPVFARYILEDTYLQGYKVPANVTRNSYMYHI